MDNITHTLFGATLARTPLGRAGRGTTAALILASNAPDIDIVAASRGALSYLEWHRGPTHGLLGVAGLGLAVAALVIGLRTAVDRHRRSRAAPQAGETAGFGALLTVSVTAVLLHVLMDLPTSYGSRLLSPFDWHWYAFDWMPIIDVYLLGVLAAGLLAGTWRRAARGRLATIALALMAANYGVRALSHERAMSLAAPAFGAALPAPCDGTRSRRVLDRWPSVPVPSTPRAGPCLVETAALPNFGSPFRWRLVAMLANGYLTRDIDLLDDVPGQPPRGSAPPEGAALHAPNHWTPPVFQAATTDAARVFLGFSRFPAVRTSVDRADITTVSWVDMRFSPPLARPGGFEPDRERPTPNLFGATVRIDPDGRILESRLGIGN